MNVIDKITQKQMNPNIPDFRVGDTVRVDVKIIEGKRQRIQAFEGVVMVLVKHSLLERFLMVLELREYSLYIHLILLILL